MIGLFYTLGVLALSAMLAVFAYLDRIYHELSRVTTGQLHEHIDVFEAEIEPRLKLDRRRAALGFSLLAQLLLAAVVVETARGVFRLVPGTAQALGQLLIFATVEVLLFAQFIPYVLLARTKGRWLRPLLPALRVSLACTWPLR